MVMKGKFSTYQGVIQNAVFVLNACEKFHMAIRCLDAYTAKWMFDTICEKVDFPDDLRTKSDCINFKINCGYANVTISSSRNPKGEPVDLLVAEDLE